MNYKIVKVPAEGKVELYINGRLEGIIAQESNFVKILFHLEEELAKRNGQKFSLESEVILQQGWEAGIYWIGEDEIQGWYINPDNKARVICCWSLTGEDRDGDSRYNLKVKESW